jgi:hypothetical protein
VALEFIGLVGSATEANQVLPKLGQEGSIVPLGLRPRAVQRSIQLSEKGESAAQQLDQTCEPASGAGFRRG